MNYHCFYLKGKNQLSKILNLYTAWLIAFGLLVPAPLLADIEKSVASTVRGEYAFSLKPVRVDNAALNRLALVNRQSPQVILARYLADNNKDPRIADSLEITREHQSKFGNTHYILEQRINGLRVYDSNIKLAVDSDNKVINIIDGLPDHYVSRIVPGSISHRQALQGALHWNFPKVKRMPLREGVDGNKTFFNKGDFFYKSPSVEDILLLKNDGTVAAGFLVFAWSHDDNLLYETVVAGDGSVIENRLRTAFDSYRVYDPFPSMFSIPAIKQGPGNGNAESPVGWLDGGTQRNVNISGNNVRAFLDRNADATADTGGTAIFDENFISFANLSQDPTLSTNGAVSVQTLFYFVNRMHDEFYRHGFTETAGNFQQSNFGRGGEGGDAVRASAQVGGSLNNATFVFAPEGEPPRMVVRLYDMSVPRRDGALDSDILWHEYTHGLTNRMIGNMNGRVSRAIDEGNSDAFSIIMTNDDVHAEYSNNNPLGNRSEPYANYSRTLSDFDTADDAINLNGEIYAAAIWRLWEIFQENNLSRDLLLGHLIDAMNFTPARADYIDMRDGILISTPPDLDCHVWSAFANFGIGVGAGISSNGTFVAESFSQPLNCTATTEPGVPFDFHIETHGGGLNELIWTSLAQASTYQIYKSVNSFTGPYSFDNEIVENQIVVHVTGNTYYKIKACNAIGCSAFTQPRLAYVQECGSIGLPPCE